MLIIEPQKVLLMFGTVGGPRSAKHTLYIIIRTSCCAVHLEKNVDPLHLVILGNETIAIIVTHQK